MLERDIFFQDFNDRNSDILGDDDEYVASSLKDSDESISAKHYFYFFHYHW